MAENSSSPEAVTDSKSPANADDKNEDEDDGIIPVLSVSVCYPRNRADITEILTFFLYCICRLGVYCGPWR